MSQEEGKIEEVSINSVYLNNKWSLITAQLEMQVSENTVKIPYKIDTGSEGNLMPLYIFKKLCSNRSVEQLKRSMTNNIKLKTYNGTQIEQLGMCMATIKFKNIKKKCVFFVVPGNSQALLGMPDTAALNIINLNIDSIQKEIRECKTNRGQEMQADAKDCTNKAAHSAAKQDGNSQQHQATHDQYEEQNDTKRGQKEANIEQYNKKAGDIQEKEIIDICERRGPAQVNPVKRTRLGHIVKNPDRLTYI